MPKEGPRLPSQLSLPVRPDTAKRTLRYILADHKKAFDSETLLIDKSNPYLGKYINALSQAVGDQDILFRIQFAEGAVWTHLMMRMQQEKEGKRLPFVKEEIIQEQLDYDRDRILRGVPADMPYYTYGMMKALSLAKQEPELTRTIHAWTDFKLGIPPSRNFIIHGAAELYFLVRRAASQHSKLH